MKKDFVQYEEALELKKLGFGEDCIYHFKKDEHNDKKHTTTPTFVVSEHFGGNHNKLPTRVSAPTYSQAFRFFREKYGYFSSPTESNDGVTKKYDWFINKNEENKSYVGFVGYHNTYEEAEVACLKKLIEIVRKK